MKSGTIFEPYETLYVDNTKQYGNINLANSRAKMLEELPQGGGFSKLPFYCYAYDSIFSQALHLNVPSYSAGEAIIRGTVIDYGEWIKHYVSFFPNMMVQNCLGDTDRISNDNYNNNIGAFKPLDIDFTKVRLGMRYSLMHKGTKQSVDVQSTKDLIENYNTGDYVVRETQCNIMYFIDGGLYSYNSNGTSDISVNYNVGDQWLFGNHPLEYGQHGLQLIPQWWIRLRDYGAEAYSPFHDADTGFVFQGLGVEEVKMSIQDDFYDLNTGCLLYKSNQFYDGVEYRPVLTVEQCLKEVAFLGLAVCDFEAPTDNLYMGYINSDGLATGELIPYSDWDKSDSLNIKYNTMSDLPDIEVKPKPTPDDDDYPDDPWGKIEWGGAYLGAGNFTNLWYCTATDLDNLRRWMNGADTSHPLPEGFNPMNQILGLMQFPIGLGGTLTEELTMRTQANVTVHSGVMINRGFGDDLYYNLGSIDIPLRMKERGVPFLDYGSIIELYVPFCGVFQLDPQTVLGADLSVEMWLSPVTGECNCIVSVGRGNNRGPVAFGSGNMAADIPVTANGYGLYAAAAKEASLKRSELMFGGATQGLQSLSSGANTANTLAIGEQIAGESISGPWGAAGAVAGGVSAAIGLGVALAQATHNIRALDVGMQHVKNASGTSVSGSFSGTSAWHYPFQCYVKITRPRYKIPSNYAHTQGVPLIKAQSLSSCNGFTMCVGTDLSSVSATEIEKEQIAAFLSNGVIV